MATDRLVTPGHVLKAVMEHERRGSRRVLSELEKLEPDLIEYLLESLTRLYHKLTDMGLSGTDARRAYRRAEKTALVCVIALRNAQRELWADAAVAPENPPPDDPPVPPV